MNNNIRFSSIISMLLLTLFNQSQSLAYEIKPWMLVDNFEAPMSIKKWTNMDVQNETSPYVENPQITIINKEPQQKNNRYLLKKPALEDIVGNRKAISFIQLPTDVAVGEMYTFYTRINVEYFPNNHSFGLSNLTPAGIKSKNYNAFEPMIRVTDKQESDGTLNDGTLMVLSGANKKYKKIINPDTGNSASPLLENNWYEVWYVVNNSLRKNGGQRYSVYVQGGEFNKQQLVFKNADFRMRREQPLTHFMAICNTGSKKKPYGNGGLKYDDIYMTKGLQLTSPIN